MLPMKNQESGPIECRICHSRTTRDLILSPCLCKGSLASVHFKCLERWLNYSSRNKCELCQFQFNVVLSRRYSCLQSISVWFRHPVNRTFILCDLVIGIVLTALVLSLICTSLFGYNRFVKEGFTKGIPAFWSECIINMSLVLLIAGYLATMYSMARDHVRPWYAWWIKCNNVKLIVDDKQTSVHSLATVVPVHNINSCTNSKHSTKSKSSSNNTAVDLSVLVCNENHQI